MIHDKVGNKHIASVGAIACGTVAGGPSDLSPSVSAVPALIDYRKKGAAQ